MDRLNHRAEEAARNAWPALKEIHYDGWLLRLGKGETRRTNSVNALGLGACDFTAKLAYCDAIYGAHGLPTYFRLRSDGDPALEAALVARGFEAEDETLTLHCDFAATPPHPVSGIELSDAPRADWLSAHHRFTGQSPSMQAVRAHLLSLIAVPVAFAALRDEEGRIASVAYGALHDGLVSIQWVATDPGQRRLGHARALLPALLQWARQRGAAGACLQVAAANAPARGLYESLGFSRELYRYHYRVR